MKYKAYLDQGAGCDYTIGCGKIIIDIDADNRDDAITKLSSVIIEDYNNMETKLYKVELYEINAIVNIDVGYIYQFDEYKRDEQRIKEETLLEKETYIRLKEKYES